MTRNHRPLTIRIPETSMDQVLGIARQQGWAVRQPAEFVADPEPPPGGLLQLREPAPGEVGLDGRVVPCILYAGRPTILALNAQVGQIEEVANYRTQVRLVHLSLVSRISGVLGEFTAHPGSAPGDALMWIEVGPNAESTDDDELTVLLTCYGDHLHVTLQEPLFVHGWRPRMARFRQIRGICAMMEVECDVRQTTKEDLIEQQIAVLKARKAAEDATHHPAPHASPNAAWVQQVVDKLHPYMMTRAAAEGVEYTLTPEYLASMIGDGNLRSAFGVAWNEYGRLMSDAQEPEAEFLNAFLKRRMQ